MCAFFFFRQKTAYEMRISDWSSDVCSSDLVKLGLFPGLGGTVRLARVAGAPLAIDWITGGAPAKAPAALAVGVVDAVSAPEALRGAALDKLREATASIDWRVRRKAKASALPLGADEAKALFDEAKAKQIGKEQD